jgi:hypothetical protein
MEIKHTPGPWHTDSAGHVYSEDAFFGKCAIAKCEIAPFPGKPGRMGVLKPNADLIAAAPDMHAALAAVDEEGRELDGDGRIVIPQHVWDLINEALIKANQSVTP